MAGIITILSIISTLFNNSSLDSGKTSSSEYAAKLNIILSNGFEKNEQIEIKIINSKGTKSVFKGRLNRSGSNDYNTFSTDILRNEVSNLEIRSITRNKKDTYGFLIEKSNRISAIIDVSQIGFKVVFSDKEQLELD